MKIKQVKLAQTLPGETSHLLEAAKYDLTFDKGILYVKKTRDNAKNLGPFMVFPANIAWISYEPEAEPVKPTEKAPEAPEAASETAAEGAKKGPGRPKK